MVSSAKKYQKLKDLKKDLPITETMLEHAIEYGFLKVSAWIPSRYVEKIICENRPLEGLVSIRPGDARTILKKGGIRLKKFMSIEDELHRVSDEQSPFYVIIDNLVVSEEQREEFEHVRKTHPFFQDFNVTKDYKKVTIRGTKFRLMGVIQRNIIKLLHEAFLKNKENPWVHIKTLADKAGSKATRIRVRDIFKNHPNWEELIDSDGRGHYRLNLP